MFFKLYLNFLIFARSDLYLFFKYTNFNPVVKNYIDIEMSFDLENPYLDPEFDNTFLG